MHCTHPAPMLLLAIVGQPPIQTTCRYLHVVSDARACAQLPSFTLAVPCRRSFHFVRTLPSFLVALRTSGVCAVADEMRTCRNVRLDRTGCGLQRTGAQTCPKKKGRTVVGNAKENGAMQIQSMGMERKQVEMCRCTSTCRKFCSIWYDAGTRVCELHPMYWQKNTTVHARGHCFTPQVDQDLVGTKWYLFHTYEEGTKSCNVDPCVADIAG